MVLYVESLRSNVANYIQVGTVLKHLCDSLGVEVRGYEESMENSQASLVVLEGLLAAGVTELKVPER